MTRHAQATQPRLYITTLRPPPQRPTLFELQQVHPLSVLDSVDALADEVAYDEGRHDPEIDFLVNLYVGGRR